MSLTRRQALGASCVIALGFVRHVAKGTRRTTAELQGFGLGQGPYIVDRLQEGAKLQPRVTVLDPLRSRIDLRFEHHYVGHVIVMEHLPPDSADVRVEIASVRETIAGRHLVLAHVAWT